MKNCWSHPAHTLIEKLKKRLRSFPRKANFFISIARFCWCSISRLILKTYFRLTFGGKPQLPKNKSCIIVANHTSHLDALVLSAALPLRNVNQTYCPAAKDFFFSTLLFSLFSVICINAIPFCRHKDLFEGLNYCRHVLSKPEHVLILFPEGTRSQSGELQPFKRGIGNLTAGTDILVIPAYIDGAHSAWSRGKKLPLPRKIEVFFGEPLSFSEIPSTKEGCSSIAELLEKQIKKLKKNASQRKINGEQN